MSAFEEAPALQPRTPQQRLTVESSPYSGVSAVRASALLHAGRSLFDAPAPASAAAAWSTSSVPVLGGVGGAVDVDAAASGGDDAFVEAVPLAMPPPSPARVAHVVSVGDAPASDSAATAAAIVAPAAAAQPAPQHSRARAQVKVVPSRYLSSAAPSTAASASAASVAQPLAARPRVAASTTALPRRLSHDVASSASQRASSNSRARRLTTGDASVSASAGSLPAKRGASAAPAPRSSGPTAAVSGAGAALPVLAVVAAAPEHVTAPAASMSAQAPAVSHVASATPSGGSQRVVVPVSAMLASGAGGVSASVPARPSLSSAYDDRVNVVHAQHSHPAGDAPAHASDPVPRRLSGGPRRVVAPQMDEDEYSVALLDLLQCQLIQWLYANQQLEEAAERVGGAARSQLVDAAAGLDEIEQKTAVAKLRVSLQQYVANCAGVIALQKHAMPSFSTLDAGVGQVREVQFAMQAALEHMPLEGVRMVAPAMSGALRDCERVLSDMLSALPPSLLSEFRDVSAGVESAQVLLSSLGDTLRMCAERAEDCIAVAAHARSLAVGAAQLRELREGWSASAGGSPLVVAGFPVRLDV